MQEVHKQVIPNDSKFCLYCGKNQLEEPAKKKALP
jgi:hypothetical protein